MEAFVLYSSSDRSLPPHKNQVANRSKNSRPAVIYTSSSGSLLSPAPPLLSSSFPPSISVLRPLNHQPPLLPLPNSKHRNRILGIQGISCPPTTNRKIKNKRRDQPKPVPRRQDSVSKSKEVGNGTGWNPGKMTTEGGLIMIGLADQFGPDPNDLPKNVRRVFSTMPNETNEVKDEFSSSPVFDISPPPSSLPLPTFSLRPKLTCNAEAAGVDAGATNNLRHLLRLQ